MPEITVQRNIEEYLDLSFDFVDFLYAYCNNKGIDDPEEDLTDEEYSEMEREAEKLITPARLRGLREAIISDINERLRYFMEEN